MGQRISAILSGSLVTRTHGKPVPSVPLMGGPCMSRALPFQVECQCDQAQQPIITHK